MYQKNGSDEQVAWDSGAGHGDNLSGICQETPRRFLPTAESSTFII